MRASASSFGLGSSVPPTSEAQTLCPLTESIHVRLLLLISIEVPTMAISARAKARIQRNKHWMDVEREASHQLQQVVRARLRGQSPMAPYVPIWMHRYQCPVCQDADAS